METGFVVPIGSPAGIFVAEYRDRLFPDTPILYTGLDRRRLPPDALEKNASLVGEEFDLPVLSKIFCKSRRKRRTIAIVLGASPLEQYWAAAFRKEFEPFTSRVNFIWLNELSFEQMLGRVKQLPPNSYIFLILLLRDASGVTHNADEALAAPSSSCDAPINSIFQHQLGLGIVGGRLYQAELEGTESARIAVRILHGESASSFPSQDHRVRSSPRYDGARAEALAYRREASSSWQSDLISPTDGLAAIPDPGYSWRLALVSCKHYLSLGCSRILRNADAQKDL
jgi:hypothetical protein